MIASALFYFMETLEYIQIPSTDSDLKFIVFYEEQELHVVIEEGATQTLKEIIQQHLKLDDVQLKHRGSK